MSQTRFEINTQISPEIQRIIDARHHDPFSILGKHISGESEYVRAFLPHAQEVVIEEGNQRLNRIAGTTLFEWNGQIGSIPGHYHLVWQDNNGQQHRIYDPYCFPPQISDYDLHLFNEGKHWHVYRILGAHMHSVNGITGVLFATWAPNAERVSVVGDFNQWDGRSHPMRIRGKSGVWELFIPELQPETLYKFEIRNRQQGDLYLKSDPYGQKFELRPDTAAIVTHNKKYTWQDKAWINKRKKNKWLNSPLSVYEVHLGSWRTDEQGNFLNYRELAHRLAEYANDMGFTHIELLPIAEHPLDASWGYQIIGAFAPTRRFGSPDDFRYFIDHLHQAGIGVIVDWVPAHFPKDAHGLARFDGTALYEYEDPKRGEHRDWGTLIFDYGRNEVRNYLLSNAIYWIEEFHIDGLRVDAVASMIYRDYSRQPGDWIANEHGGNENQEAITLLREVNSVTQKLHKGCLMIAEESTAWPQVTRPTEDGGLGFSMKWNMGWMHDTLVYMSKDPVHRKFHQNVITFGLLYAFTENFVLPFSHDEVVHGKQSMINKMPGDDWQRYANLRMLYGYMFTYPGKKLLFMGNEFAHGHEWRHDRGLEWFLLEYDDHRHVQNLVRDLNKLYCSKPALYHHDFDHQGFEWIDCHDAENSVISYLRRYKNDIVIVVINFTPVPRPDYRIGVPFEGKYHEVVNTDSSLYGGSNSGNKGKVSTENREWMGRPYSLNLTLPPLGCLVLELESLELENLELENPAFEKKPSSN